MPSRPDAIVWVADDEVAAGLDYGVRLAERLRGRGLSVHRVDLINNNGQIPPAQLHVLSGGGTSVNDRSGWMREGLELTRSLVNGAQRAEHTLLGVCLGSQMIAEALWPGSVRRGERIEVGLMEVWWRPSIKTNGERLVVPAFHYEEIDRAHVIKGGATITAENLRTGIQAFRLGHRVWGVQFHPELRPDDIRQMVSHHQDTIEMHNNSVDAALEAVATLEPRWRRHTFDKVVDQVTRRDETT